MTIGTDEQQEYALLKSHGLLTYLTYPRQHVLVNAIPKVKEVRQRDCSTWHKAAEESEHEHRTKAIWQWQYPVSGLGFEKIGCSTNLGLSCWHSIATNSITWLITWLGPELLSTRWTQRHCSMVEVSAGIFESKQSPSIPGALSSVCTIYLHLA